MNIKDLRILALIPARGGSKRLPGKNIKTLCGKPLIAWSIEAALTSKYVREVFVSTDCAEIAQVSKEFEAEVPFIRPANISGDETGTEDVILHLLETIPESSQYSHILLLQPTSPLRTSLDIEKSVELLVGKEANTIYSVCEVDHSPLWMNTLPEDKLFDDFLKPEVAGLRSQDLPKNYRLNGAIYLVSLDCFRKTGSLFGHKKSYAYEMSRENSIDIDEQIDFIITESILKMKLSDS